MKKVTVINGWSTLNMSTPEVVVEGHVSLEAAILAASHGNLDVKDGAPLDVRHTYLVPVRTWSGSLGLDLHKDPRDEEVLA